MISPDTPRRYAADEQGRRVLFGLTLKETSEFEKLDSRLVVPGAVEQGFATDARFVTAEERRWLELYVKHDEAWRQWMAARRTATGGPFSGVQHFPVA